MPNELRPQSVAVQIVLGLMLFTGSLAIAWHAVQLDIQGKQYSSIEAAGLSLIVIGGSLNPVNFLWMCLPFTRNELVAPSRFAPIGWFIGGIGFIPFVIGLIGRHIAS